MILLLVLVIVTEDSYGHVADDQGIVVTDTLPAAVTLSCLCVSSWSQLFQYVSGVMSKWGYQLCLCVSWPSTRSKLCKCYSTWSQLCCHVSTWSQLYKCDRNSSSVHSDHRYQDQVGLCSGRTATTFTCAPPTMVPPLTMPNVTQTLIRRFQSSSLNISYK